MNLQKLFLISLVLTIVTSCGAETNTPEQKSMKSCEKFAEEKWGERANFTIISSESTPIENMKLDTRGYDKTEFVTNTTFRTNRDTSTLTCYCDADGEMLNQEEY